MRFQPLHLAVAAAVTSLAWAGLSAPAKASGDDFYKGKQVAFMVSSATGGSYDGFARMISRHISRHIPGSPDFVVQNMPGAGGLRGANWLYNVAPRDGLTIGMINNTIVFDPIYGNKQAQYDAEKFNWIGTPSQEIGLLIVWHTVPVYTLEDARKREIVLAASGAGSTPAFYARVLSSLFDLKVKIIPGYKSQTDSFLAMERGENDGNASPFWSSLKSNYSQWITEKKIRPLVYYGNIREPEINAPHALDILKDPEKRAIMELAQAGLVMGRPIAAPPGVDPSRVAILRAGLMAVFKDPQYLAECEKMKLDCSAPMNADEMAAHVRRVHSMPDSAKAKISDIYWTGRR